MITFKGVTKQYAPNHCALIDLNFHISKGEMIFIKGHSGAGKSTILSLIAGLERVCKGEILVDQFKIHKLSTRQTPAYRRRLGIIFQNPLLLNHRCVYDNVAIPLILEGLYNSEISKRVYLTLDRVGLLAKAKLLPTQLSGGEQQRLGIARAIIHKPSILLADEPTGNLDPTLSTDMMDLFTRLNQKGVTVIIATHDNSLLEHTLQYHSCRDIELTQGQISCIR